MPFSSFWKDIKNVDTLGESFRVPTRSGNSGSQGKVREFGSLAKVRESKEWGGDILSEYFFCEGYEAKTCLIIDADLLSYWHCICLS